MGNLLDFINEEEKSLIITKRFSKNEMIFLENSVCDCIGVVLLGQIDIVSYSFSGKEIVYNSLKKNEVFGNNLLFSDFPNYRGNVIAKESSEVAFIKKNALIQLLQSNEKFLLEYLKIQSNFGKALNGQIKLLSFDKALDRFKYYLLMNNNTIHYKNVSSLAKTLYLERETLSRLLSKLEKEGVIYRDKHLIKLL